MANQANPAQGEGAGQASIPSTRDAAIPSTTHASIHVAVDGAVNLFEAAHMALHVADGALHVAFDVTFDAAEKAVRRHHERQEHDGEQQDQPTHHASCQDG